MEDRSRTAPHRPLGDQWRPAIRSAICAMRSMDRALGVVSSRRSAVR